MVLVFAESFVCSLNEAFVSNVIITMGRRNKELLPSVKSELLEIISNYKTELFELFFDLRSILFKLVCEQRSFPHQVCLVDTEVRCLTLCDL